jgi:hypothetical protein
VQQQKEDIDISLEEEEEETTTSVSIKARQAGESLKELITAAIKEAKDKAQHTGKQLKDQTLGIAVTTDSKDIRSLGSSDVQTMTMLFEEMMSEIRKEGYDEQVILLDGYKRLLDEQIRVVRSRLRLASRLKPGA